MKNLIWGKTKMLMLYLVLGEPIILMGLSHDKAVAQQTQAKKPNISHEEERIALILFLTGCFVRWNIFR